MAKAYAWALAATRWKWTFAFALCTAAFAAHFAAGVKPASAFRTDPFEDTHEDLTRRALSFVAGHALSTIVAGNEDEDEDDEANATERHGQNCRFRDSANYINMRYRDIVASLRQPLPNDPNRAARLFGHILHGAQDFYSHSNWIPNPPEGLGIRGRLLDSGLGLWTVREPYSRLFDDVVIIEGMPPKGVSAILPRNADGQAISGVPLIKDRRRPAETHFSIKPLASAVSPVTETYRGLMTSVSGDIDEDHPQLCPPVGSSCAITIPPGRGPSELCLRHGAERSHGSGVKTFWVEIKQDGSKAKRGTEGRMNMDGGGGGEFAEARRHAKLQSQHEWCRLLHLSRDLDPSFGASALLLGSWVTRDSGADTPHISGTACQRAGTRPHLVEISTTVEANAPRFGTFVVFRGDFTDSARANVSARQTRTLSLCGNANDTIAVGLNGWNVRGPTVRFQMPNVAKSWESRDHRGAFGGAFNIKVTPNGCSGASSRPGNLPDAQPVPEGSGTAETPQPVPPAPAGRSSVIRTGAGRCLDVHAPDMAKNGARVQAWSCNGQPQQLWTYDRATKAIRVASGLCLDVHAPDMGKNGGRVQMWSCNGQVQQQWTPVPGGALRNGGGLCLDVHAADQLVNGARVQVWACNGSQQQRFGSGAF